jgi:hypothetical protein
MFLLGHFSLVDEATFVGRVPVSRRRGELRPSTVSRTGLWRWCIWNFEISMWENLVHIHISSYNIIYPSYMIWWYTLKIHRIHGDPREIFCEKIVSKKPPDSKRCSVWFLQRRVTVIFLAQDPPPWLSRKSGRQQSWKLPMDPLIHTWLHSVIVDAFWSSDHFCQTNCRSPQEHVFASVAFFPTDFQTFEPLVVISQ